MTIQGVITQIRTTNLHESIDFYTKTLGLELAFQYEDFYAGIKVGDQEFHLKLIDDKDPSIDFIRENDHLCLYFPVDNVDEMAVRLKSKGVVLLSEPRDQPWGNRDFIIEDNQGHRLVFASPLD